MQSYLGRMMSTAWPRFSSSRLRPKTTSPNPPACATGAHSEATITMNTAVPPRHVSFQAVLRPLPPQPALAVASILVPSTMTQVSAPEREVTRRSIAGLRMPRPTLRPRPHGRRRTAWGRYDSLCLYRKRLSLHIPRRSPAHGQIHGAVNQLGAHALVWLKRNEGVS